MRLDKLIRSDYYIRKYQEDEKKVRMYDFIRKYRKNDKQKKKKKRYTSQ